MSMSNLPRRGEIWLADLGDADPVPVVIVSANALEQLPLRLVALLRPWEDRFADFIWLQKIDARWPAQLAQPHAADLLQLRSVERHRLQRQIGRVPATRMDEIAAAIALIVDFVPASQP